MKKITSVICAAAMTLTTLAAGAGSSVAAPFSAPRSVQVDASSNVVEVQNRRGFHRRGDRAWYNGHRGHRQWRRGYRSHNGFWFAPSAFIAGAIIGAAPRQAAPRPVYRGNSAHLRWCQNRYRSYRAYDNTFQPYHGPRQACISPYS